MLSAEHLEHDATVIPLCNGNYDHLEREGLALSCDFGKKLNISSFLYNGILGRLNRLTVRNIAQPVFNTQFPFLLLPSYRARRSSQ